MNMSFDQIRTVFKAEIIKKHVLIIDDENTAKDFWEELLLSMIPGVSVHGATSIAQVEKMIKGFKGNPYDLVISSFWLEGAERFYHRYGRGMQNFIFVSDLPISAREQRELLDRGLPVYLQKPFSLDRCRHLVRALCDLNNSVNHAF